MNFLANVQDAFLRDAWAERIGWTLVHSLWQIALLAGLYAALMLALRKRSAATRYVAGCGTLLAMLIVPVGTYLLLPHQASRVVVQAETARLAAVESHATPVENPKLQQSHRVDPELAETATAPEPEVSPTAATGPAAAPSVARSRLSISETVLRPCLPWATAAWLAGVLLLSLRPVLGWLHVRRLQRSGLSALPESLQSMGERLCRRLGVPGAVRFAQSALVEVPAVVGYLRPLVLLPASVVSGLSPSELEMILAHELAHVRRHDYVVNLAQTVIEALLFYHPGMWWVSGQIRREREYCCDDLAVALGGSPVSYAQMLARLAIHSSAPPATVLAATGGPLLSRVRRLLGHPQAEISHRNVAGWLASLTILALVALILATGSVPARVLAESPPPPAELGKLSEEISSRVVRLIDSCKLPFMTDERLEQIGAEFSQLVEKHQGQELSDERKLAILVALDTEGAKLLRLDGFRHDEQRSLNATYLEWSDRLKTMQWKLFMALTRGPLSAEEMQRQETQRQWMRDHIRSLPVDRFVQHQAVLERLEANFRNPWCTVLDRPMTDEQFAAFQAALEKYPPNTELRSVTSHIVSAALLAMYRRPGDLRLPFDDHVIRLGSSNDTVKLGFKSNALFRGSSKAFRDAEQSYTVVDATTGHPVTAPPAQREREKLAAWLDNHGKGDFAFTSSGVDGATLVGVRGATLLRLDVENWVQADAISNETLQGLLAQEGTDKIALRPYYDALRERDKVQPFAELIGPYVGVLTREGHLAVVQVENFSGPEWITYRTRPRASDTAPRDGVPKGDEPGAPRKSGDTELALGVTLEDGATEPLKIALLGNYSRPVKSWENVTPGDVRLELPELEVGTYLLDVSAKGYGLGRVVVTVSGEGVRTNVDSLGLYRRRYAVLRYAVNLQGARKLTGPFVKEGRVAISFGSVPDLHGDWLIRQVETSPVLSFHRIGANGFASPPADVSFEEIDTAPQPNQFKAESVVAAKGTILLNRIEGNGPGDRRYAKILVEDVTESPPQGVQVIDTLLPPTISKVPPAPKLGNSPDGQSSGEFTMTVRLEDDAQAPIVVELRDATKTTLKVWDHRQPGEIRVRLPELDHDHYTLVARAEGYSPATVPIAVSETGLNTTEATVDLHRLRYLIVRYVMNTKGKRELSGPDTKGGRVAVSFGHVPELGDWSVGQSEGQPKVVHHRVSTNSGFASAPEGQSFDELEMAPPPEDYDPGEFVFEKGMVLFNRVIGHRPEFARYAKLLVEDITETRPTDLEVIDSRHPATGRVTMKTENGRPADEARRLVIKGKFAKWQDFVLRIEGDKEPSEWRTGGGDFEGPYEVLFERSDQIRLEGGKTGHGLVVSIKRFTSEKSWNGSTFFLTGNFVLRRKAEFVTKDDVLTVADLLLDDGQKRPVTLRMEPFSKRKPLD